MADDIDGLLAEADAELTDTDIPYVEKGTVRRLAAALRATRQTCASLAESNLLFKKDLERAEDDAGMWRRAFDEASAEARSHSLEEEARANRAEHREGQAGIALAEALNRLEAFRAGPVVKHGHHADYSSTCLDCNHEHLRETLHERDRLRAELAAAEAEVDEIAKAGVLARLRLDEARGHVGALLAVVDRNGFGQVREAYAARAFLDHTAPPPETDDERIYNALAPPGPRADLAFRRIGKTDSVRAIRGWDHPHCDDPECYCATTDEPIERAPEPAPEDDK